MLFRRSFSSPTAVQRYGAVFFVVAFLGRLFFSQEQDVAKFCFDALSMLAAAFIGPAGVQLTCRLLHRDLDGIALLLVTLLACSIVALGLALFFRSFL